MYVSKTFEEAQRWYDIFIQLDRPTFSIVKVSVDVNTFVGDACNCFDGTIDRDKNLALEENYWKNENNYTGKEPIVEILVIGKIKVMEIIKENENIK